MFVGGIPKTSTVTDEQLLEFAEAGGEVPRTFTSTSLHAVCPSHVFHSCITCHFCVHDVSDAGGVRNSHPLQKLTHSPDDAQKTALNIAVSFGCVALTIKDVVLAPAGLFMCGAHRARSNRSNCESGLRFHQVQKQGDCPGSDEEAE